MKPALHHRTNRRRFLQATAGASIGVLAGELPDPVAKVTSEPREAPKPASNATALPASLGVAQRCWIDPSIAA